MTLCQLLRALTEKSHFEISQKKEKSKRKMVCFLKVAQPRLLVWEDDGP